MISQGTAELATWASPHEDKEVIRGPLVAVVPLAWLLAGASLSACQRPEWRNTYAPAAPSPTPSSASLPGPEEPPADAAVPIRTEEVAVPDDLPALVVRGSRPDALQMLFLPGMCVHPSGYVTSFQETAARRGDLVALQGDVSCGGDGSMRRWSNDLEAMNRRIDAAFVASGLGVPREVVVIGYSQGAERAERLVARWPEKYSSAVLMSGPVKPSKGNLARARSMVLMAGTREPGAGAKLKSAIPELQRASVPVTFIEIPGAQHGELGTDPAATMDEALEFVEEQLAHVPLDSGLGPSNR
jgi:predicted esterase